MPYLIGSLAGQALGWFSWWVAVRARVLPFDRRGRVDRGRFDLPLSSGSCAVVRPVVVRFEPPAAAGAVLEILAQVGAGDVVALDGWTVAGWLPMSWRSFGQQVGVIVQPTGPDTVTLWCCSRPRLATTLFDWHAGSRSVRSLVDEVCRTLPTLA